MRMTTAIVLVLGLASASLAQSDQPTLDELLDLAPAEPSAEEAPQRQADDPAKPRAGEGDLTEQVRELVSEANPADVLEQALRQMDAVSVRLGRELDAGVATQREQESILAKLDQVIAAARQQQASSASQGGSGQQGQQNSPRAADQGGRQVAQQSRQGAAGQQQRQAQASDSDPGAAPPPGPEADAEQAQRPLDELRSEWGNLPPRVRDELTEGLSEQFSPLYRELTEAYYRRLAEEQ